MNYHFQIIKNRINSAGFVHDVSILATGTTIAQIIPFILYPLIGRLYSPEQAAILATFSSIVAIIQVVSTGKYEGAIFLADSDKDAANTLALALSLCLLTCVTITISLLFFPNMINRYLNIDIGNMIYLIPLSVFGISVFDAYNEWCIRKKYYKKLSLNKITSSIAVNSGKVGFAFTSLFHWGLVVGDVCGRVFTTTVCICRLWISDGKIFRKISFKGMKEQANLFSKFPKFSVPAQLLNTLGASMPVLILATKFDETEVGLFSMALAVMYVPISIVGRAIRDIFRRRIRDAYGNSKTSFTMFIKLLKDVSLLALIVALAGVYFLPSLFSLVLGEKWEQSGVYSQLMTPFFAFNFISTCVDGILIVAQKLKQLFAWQILYCFCSIIPILIGVCVLDDLSAVIILFSLFKIISDVCLIALSYHYAKWLDKVVY